LAPHSSGLFFWTIIDQTVLMSDEFAPGCVSTITATSRAALLSHGGEYFVLLEPLNIQFRARRAFPRVSIRLSDPSGSDVLGETFVLLQILQFYALRYIVAERVTALNGFDH
jgi:hypothetical protein